MKIAAFVIHLERAAQRRPQVERLRQSLPMGVEVIDAVDGRELGEDEIASVYLRHLHRPRYPFRLSASEVACFMSHRKVWQRIADSDLDAALIVEDDVEVDQPKLQAVLDAFAPRMTRDDYLRLPRKMRESGPVLEGTDGLVFRPRMLGLGMQLQLVGPGAAARLLETTRQFDRPVDTLLQLRRLHPGVRFLCSRDVLAREIAVGGSLVQKKRKSLADLVSREVGRPLYRLAVWLDGRRR